MQLAGINKKNRHASEYKVRSCLLPVSIAVNSADDTAIGMINDAMTSSFRMNKGMILFTYTAILEYSHVHMNGAPMIARAIRVSNRYKMMFTKPNIPKP